MVSSKLLTSKLATERAYQLKWVETLKRMRTISSERFRAEGFNHILGVQHIEIESANLHMLIECIRRE